MALKAFLQRTKDLDSFVGQSKRLRIVLGNESCDLDSAVSAVSYAFLLQTIDKKEEYGAVIPILNICRKDFPLRTEVKHLFDNFSIDSNILTFRDDLNFEPYIDLDSLDICLVDHNILPPVDALLDIFVSFVLDHHQLERTSTPVHGMIVEPVGSCCTLVAEQIIEKCSELLLPEEEVCKLLHATIVLDTVNLSESAKRATKKDVEIISQLETALKYEEKDRNLIFEELTTAKGDISKLTTEEVIRKDLKVVSGRDRIIAMSSVPMLIQNFFDRADVECSLCALCEEREWDGVVLMGIDVSGPIKRDLAIYSTGNKVRQELCKYLCDESKNLDLSLVESICEKTSVFNQANITASRKVVLPFVKQWLEER